MVLDNLSLNDILLKEPCIQEELVFIMVKCRTHIFVLSVDITKVFRQMLVSKAHRDAQRIL